MPAQPRRLIVPPAKLRRARRLRLPERVPEVVQEAVGTGRGQSLDELVAVPDERRVAPLGVLVQDDPPEREGLDGSYRRLCRQAGRLDGDRGLRLERGAGDSARHRVGTRRGHLAVVLGRRPDHADVRTRDLAAVYRRDLARQPREPAHGCFGLDVGDRVEPRRQRRFAGNGGGRDGGRGSRAAAAASLARRRRVEDRGHLGVGQRHAIYADVAQPPVERRCAFVLRAADVEAVRVGRAPTEELRCVDADVGRLAGPGAADIGRQETVRWIEDDRQMDPLVHRNGFRLRHAARLARGEARAEAAGRTHCGKQPARRIPSEVEDGPGGAGWQVEPARDADHVFPGEGIRGKLRVAAVARELQGPAEARVFNVRGPASDERGMEVVPGRVLGVAVEEVACDERRFANPVKELVAPLSGDEDGHDRRQNGGRHEFPEMSRPAPDVPPHGRSSYQRARRNSVCARAVAPAAAGRGSDGAGCRRPAAISATIGAVATATRRRHPAWRGSATAEPRSVSEPVQANP